LLRFQWVTEIIYNTRCISDPKVRLKRYSFEIIPKATSARANLLKDAPACTERRTDRSCYRRPLAVPDHIFDRRRTTSSHDEFLRSMR
jgi:hypothetical protein